MMKPKVMILIPKSRSVPRGIPAQVFHRDFLGAHRYTTGHYVSPPVCVAHLPLCVLCAWRSSKEQSFTKHKVCPVSPSVSSATASTESEVQSWQLKTLVPA